MLSYNFTQREITDFIEHWIPILNDYDYYYIYPQTNSLIKNVIELNFSIQPDHVGRLYYGIIGANVYQEIPEALIESFNRDGFTVIEWGVFRK